MARVAALLPCSPTDLLDLDLPMFNELARQVVEREREWTRRDEMAAQQVEITHLLWRTLVAVNSEKGARSIPEYRVPRPGDDDTAQDTVRVLTHREMAALIGGAV